MKTAAFLLRISPYAIFTSCLLFLPVATAGTDTAENIAPTAATAGHNPLEVYGQPRVSRGHPCTIWDQDDIARMKKLLATSPALQAEFAQLQKDLDKRIAQPLGVPPVGPEPTRATYRVHEKNMHSISDLGTMYAISGQAKYGEFARAMLLAYARNYPRYAHPAGWTVQRYRSAKDGRITGQFLEDGLWLIAVARGYDLVYNLPSWSASERRLLRSDLFEAVAAEFVADVISDRDYLSQTHNRSAICTCGVLLAGYACDDDKLINYGLYGKNGTREKPTGGVFGVHFGPQCIDVDGMWNEGAMGYQFMALGSLIDEAETLWHHGIDMYRYRGGALKRLFDSPLQFMYPDLTFPATHDSSRRSILLDWYTDCQQAYEYGYLRYRDPRYLAVINAVPPHLKMSSHEGPISVLYDRRPNDKPSLPCESVNFMGVGYGILRLPTAQGTASLLLEYGPGRSHGHPSKLDLDLFAQGDVLLPDPGVIFPYGDSLDKTWYWTTLAHNALLVDEKSQIYGDNRWKSRDLPDPDAQQTVYGPAATMGIQRAVSSTVYPGVKLDRAVFFTPHYLADLHAANSSTRHKYDLAWHIRGSLSTSLPLQTMRFPKPVAEGYNALGDVRHAAGDEPWSVTVARKNHQVRLLAAGGAGTEVIVGQGFYHLDETNEKTPAIIERRNGSATLYGNVVDFSDDKRGYVRSVAQQGSIEAGFALLEVATGQGTDLCFASYRPGTHKAAGLETDALQALVLMHGDEVRAMYLGGGSRLKAAGAALWRTTPGLASVEKLSDGGYIVCNPSPSPASIAVTLPPLEGRKAFLLDDQGRRSGAAVVAKSSSGGSLILKLGPAQKVEFAAAR